MLVAATLTLLPAIIIGACSVASAQVRLTAAESRVKQLYVFSPEDLADLIAHLKRVGKDRDPGITDNKIVIGSIVPASATLTEMGQAVRALLTAYFDEVNSQGGIYNRRLELKITETAETPTATRANLERLLRDEQVFAMTGAFIAGSEKEIVSLVAEHGVPLIGPLTLLPQTGVPLNRQVFYLLSGLDGQARALINFAASKPELRSSGLAVIYPSSELNEISLVAIKDQSKSFALKVPEVRSYTPGRFDVAETVKQLKQTNHDNIFFLGGAEDLLSFMREAEKVSWFPIIFLPGPGVGAGVFNAPAGFDGKVFISFPTSPADQTTEGVKEFRALAEKYRLSPKHVAAQVSAYASAKILVEALKRAGKEVSREKLIQVLEGFSGYSTGLTPAITYAPNRRIGAMGAYVVTVSLKEKQFLPASGWVEIAR